jgi:hypothetical protein|tara:strand:+ start:584 stop:769 length:186 start_codon:yes stop_codon:yes gene_type:complete
MTYQELKDYLNELPNGDEKLKDDVTIYDGHYSEFSSVVDLMTHNGNDVLHDNHLYFAFQID